MKKVVCKKYKLDLSNKNHFDSLNKLNSNIITNNKKDKIINDSLSNINSPQENEKESIGYELSKIIIKKR